MEPRERQERIDLLKSRRDMMLNLASAINVVKGTVDQILKKDQGFGKELESRIVKPLISVSGSINKALVYELSQLEFNEQENWLVLRAAFLAYIKLNNDNEDHYRDIGLFNLNEKERVIIVDPNGILHDLYFNHEHININILDRNQDSFKCFMQELREMMQPDEWDNFMKACQDYVEHFEEK